AQDETVDIAGIKLARRKLTDIDKDALRGVADSLKAKIKTGVVVLAAGNDGKVQIVVAVTPDLTARIKARQIGKEIGATVGGRGAPGSGGRRGKRSEKKGRSGGGRKNLKKKGSPPLKRGARPAEAGRYVRPRKPPIGRTGVPVWWRNATSRFLRSVLRYLPP